MTIVLTQHFFFHAAASKSGRRKKRKGSQSELGMLFTLGFTTWQKSDSTARFCDKIRTNLFPYYWKSFIFKKTTLSYSQKNTVL